MASIKPQFTEIVQPQFNKLWVACSTMSSLAERVSEAIEASKVEIPAIAKKCGVSVQAVYKWMNGRTQNITGEHLIDLADLTHHEARWLISGKGEKRKDQKAVAVYMAMQYMPEYKKDMLVQASNSLAEQPKHNGTQ